MAFQIKPFKELIALTKEKLEESMIPFRVRAAKAKSEQMKIDIEVKMLELESKINTACASKEIDFAKVINMIDEYELLERQLKQVNELTNKLFPE